MNATSTISSQFKISIPKEVREQQGWRAGQKLVFLPHGKSVIILPAPEPADLVGLARGVKSRQYRDRKDRY